MQTYTLSKLLILSFLFTAFHQRAQAQLNVTITPTHITCEGAANGKATANPSGGLAPYTFKWSNNATTQTIQNLLPGSYFVTVTDANLGSKVAATSINQPPQLLGFVSGQSQICALAPDGKATVVPSGGTPPYNYQWSNGQGGAQISNLSAGTYTVTISDAQNCTTSKSVTLDFWDEGLWLMSSFVPNWCAYNEGEAHVSASSGTPPFQYAWSTGDTNASITGLAYGLYTVTVTDVNGCQAQKDIEVPLNNSLLSILAYLPNPFCLNTIATFAEEKAPDIYPDKLWTLSDPADQIISGQGTDTIQVQWASVGTKIVQYQYGANGIFCSNYSYSLQVVVCAGTQDIFPFEVKLSPNPFSELFGIEFPNDFPENGTAVLTDISGAIRIKKDLAGPFTNVETSTLPAGIYFLQISSGKAAKTWKLIKI